MRVPYSVFEGARAVVVKTCARSVEQATHIPRSSPSLPEITNDPVPFGPSSVWSEGRRGAQSSHGDLCTEMESDDIWMEYVK